MLSGMSFNKLTRGKNQRVHENLDKNLQILERAWALGNLP